LISSSQWSPDGALALSVANCGLMNPGIDRAAATTLRARLVITLLKTPAYRKTVKGTRGFVVIPNFTGPLPSEQSRSMKFLSTLAYINGYAILGSEAECPEQSNEGRPRI
jgi:hypothetical protein